MIYVGNLVDAIIHCINEPLAAGQVFCVSDDHDVSTPVLIRLLSKALGRSSCLYALPSTWMLVMGRLFGCEAQVKRLVGSLALDVTKIRSRTGWIPPFSLAEGIAATAHWYLRSKYRLRYKNGPLTKAALRSSL